MMVLGAYVAITRTAAGLTLVAPGSTRLAGLAVSLATLELVTAAVGRLPGIFIPLGPIALGVGGLFVVTDLSIVAIAVYDWRSRGRIHPATLWGGGFLIASQLLRGIIGTTAWWAAFTGWLTS
jgi:hypothetical protein